MNRLNMSRVTLLTLTAALASANAVNGLTHGDETPTEDPTAARTRAADTPTDGDCLIYNGTSQLYQTRKINLVSTARSH